MVQKFIFWSNFVDFVKNTAIPKTEDMYVHNIHVYLCMYSMYQRTGDWEG